MPDRHLKHAGIFGLGLVGWLIVCLAAGGIGVLFPPGPWYAALERPPLTPPDIVFGPVWTMLYLLMAIAAWRVSLHGSERQAVLALGVFLSQMLLNGIWTPVFFGLHRMGWALIIIVLLLALIVLTIALFWKLERLAGVILLPYLAWVSFATYLNAGFWWLS